MSTDISVLSFNLTQTAEFVNPSPKDQESA